MTRLHNPIPITGITDLFGPKMTGLSNKFKKLNLEIKHLAKLNKYVFTAMNRSSLLLVLFSSHFLSFKISVTKTAVSKRLHRIWA